MSIIPRHYLHSEESKGDTWWKITKEGKYSNKISGEGKACI